MAQIEFTEHPEGGRFCEVYRSDSSVTKDGRQKNVVTHIYFSLNPDEVSKFHKVASDEIWNLYQGQGVILYTWDGTPQPPVATTLSATSNVYCHTIPAGVWQAARPLADTVLLGCTVAPGFEFADFTLMEQHSSEHKILCEMAPQLAELLP